MSDEDAAKCFELRCKSKSGARITAKEQKFLGRMFLHFPDHYAEMTEPAFHATKPFGSRC